MCEHISLAFRIARFILAVLFSDWLPILNFALQCVALAVLVWYALETLRIRRASQEQAEAVQKPCLTLATAARGYEDAVLDMGGVVGGMIVGSHEGNVALWNVGSGPALNARYRFEPIDPATVARPNGYLQIVLAKETFVMAVAREVLQNLQYEFVITYESLSGRR